MKYFIVSLCIPFSLTCMSPEYDNEDDELDISYSVSFPTSASFSIGEMSSIFCYNIRPSDEDYQKQSPLHAAIEKNDKEQFKALLSQQDIDVNQKDFYNATPLHIAAVEPHGAYFIELLASIPYIDFTSKDRNNNSPFDVGITQLSKEGNNTSAIQQLIRVSPNHCKIVNYSNFMTAIKCIKESNEATAVAIKDVLKELIHNDITFDVSPEKAESFFKYLTDPRSSIVRNEFYLSHITSGDFSSDSNSKKAPEFSLLTKDVNEKLPIDYAWEGKNIPILVAMLSAGSPLPSKTNLKDIKNHLDTLDVKKLSDTKKRLMTTNTAQFIKKRHLGKQALSRNLRINRKSHVQKQVAFDSAV